MIRPFGDDPADVEQQRRRHQQDAEGDEKGDGLLAPGHKVILGNAECKMQNANRACTQKRVKAFAFTP